MTIQDYLDNHGSDIEFCEEEEWRQLELKKKDDKIEELENELDDYKYYWETLSNWLKSFILNEKGVPDINTGYGLRIGLILEKMAELEGVENEK